MKLLVNQLDYNIYIKMIIH